VKLTPRHAYIPATLLVIAILVAALVQLNQRPEPPRCPEGWMPTAWAHECCAHYAQSIVAPMARCISGDGGAR
jgi:hypothetical protein